MAYLGIDLGTTNSVAAIYNDKNDEIEIVKLDGEDEILPSVVCFQSGEIIVGKEAKEGAIIYPDTTIIEVKREMGQEITYKIDEKEYKPEEISAEILKTLKNAAEKQFNEKFNEVVITHPAYFNDRQIYATKLAGELAGFKDVHLLSEPLSAAVEYGFKQNYAQTLLIYDFGGGTFDVCILKITKDARGNEVYSELSDVGDMLLGGTDFDQCLIDYMLYEFKFKNSIDIEKLDQETTVRLFQRLKKEAEQIKIKLSSVQKVEVKITPLIVEKGMPYNLVMEITREQFESLIREKIEKTSEIIDEALERSSLDKDDISKVILVGGTTLVPMVQRMVAGSIKEPYRSKDPAKTVAMGAAIYNYLLHLPSSPVKVAQIARMNLGTRAITNIETLEKEYVPIIQMGTQIPVKITDKGFKTFANATAAAVDVFQWENIEDENKKYIGTVLLDNIKGDTAVEVTYSINENNIFEVYLKDTSTGRLVTTTFDREKTQPAPDRTPVTYENKDAYNVVFVIDTTGSMEYYIDGVKDKAIEFSNILKSNGSKYQLGVIGFGDLGEKEKPKVNKFTSDIVKFKKYVKKLPRYYGGDIPESSLDAVETAIDLIDSSILLENSRTIMILITDAESHTPTQKGNDSDKIGETLRTKGITTYVVAKRDLESVKQYTPLIGSDGHYYNMNESFNDILDSIAHEIVELVRII
jgi:molecular chaperone DnaK